MSRTILILALVTLVNTVSAITMQVNVLTLSTLPLSVNATPTVLDKNTRANVQVSMLDFPTRLLATVNQKMKATHFSDQDASQHYLKNTLIKYKVALQHAYMGIGLATGLQIHQLPAVVFNQHYVVYGTTDVSAAYEAYKAWQQHHGVVA